MEAYLLPKMHVLLFPSPVEAVSVSRQEPGVGVRSLPAPCWCFSTTWKLCQRVGRLILPYFIFHKYQRSRPVVWTISFLTMPKSGRNSGVFKHIHGWSPNTLAFSSFTKGFSRLKDELVTSWPCLTFRGYFQLPHYTCSSRDYQDQVFFIF